MLDQRAETRNQWNQFIRVRTGTGDVLDCRALDISPTGVGIQLEDRLSPGEVVQLLVNPHGAEVRVPVMGVVRWCGEVAGVRRAGLQLLG